MVCIVEQSLHNVIVERAIQKSVAVPENSWVTVDVYGDPNPDAPSLLVLPGVMSDADSWRHVAREVRCWPSVAVVNRRGRGPSGPLGAAYSLRTEVADLLAVLGRFGGVKALFGWSYGGTIALMAAEERPVERLIAYEPVVRPFARQALPALAAAAADQDWDRSVEIVNTDVSGFPYEHVRALRADEEGWAALRRLSEPLHAELSALNGAPIPPRLAQHARRIDLIIGETNIGGGPYGTSFEDVRGGIDQPGIHVLAGQGHLAHVHAPAQLAGLIDSLALCAEDAGIEPAPA